MISKQNNLTRKPLFNFATLVGYDWLLEQELVGFEPFSSLQPWYFLDEKTVFSITDKWPGGPYENGELVAFARRQDNDEIACFSVNSGQADCIIVVHGWTSQGYEVVAKYDSLWDWLKSLIDDIAEWVNPVDDFD